MFLEGSNLLAGNPEKFYHKGFRILAAKASGNVLEGFQHTILTFPESLQASVAVFLRVEISRLWRQRLRYRVDRTHTI